MAAPRVMVYSTSTCPWCHKAKEWLKEHKIAFKDINVGDDAKARDHMIEASGQMGVPVIEIGKTIIVGFDEPKLKKALGIR